MVLWYKVSSDIGILKNDYLAYKQMSQYVPVDIEGTHRNAE
jgi:hypothetical protein